MFSALGELEPRSGTPLAIFFAFFLSRVPGKKSRFFKRWPELAVHFDQGPAYSMFDSPGLAGDAAAADIHEYVVLVRRTGKFQGLPDNHPCSLAGEVILHRTSIDKNSAGSWNKPGSGHRRLSSSGSIINDFTSHS
jgi:hypothetical protein